jgi:hypothetical protein
VRDRCQRFAGLRVRRVGCLNSGKQSCYFQLPLPGTRPTDWCYRVSSQCQSTDGTVVTVDGDGVSPETLTLNNVEFAPGNLLPEGSVIINVTATQGETRTADVSGVSDGDGINDARLVFQWLRDAVAIAGAKGQLCFTSRRHRSVPQRQHMLIQITSERPRGSQALRHPLSTKPERRSPEQMIEMT